MSTVSYEVAQLSAAGSEARTSVEIRPGTPEVEVSLQLTDSAQIAVEVRSERGEPVDALAVGARRVLPPPAAELNVPAPKAPAATALGDGRYRIGPIPSADYLITVDDGVNPQLQATVHSDRSSPLTLSWPSSAAIRGRVVDDRGLPLENVWVEAVRDAPGSALTSYPGKRRALSDAQGQFELSQLAASGKYRLRASEPYGSAATLSAVTPGQDVTLRLPQSAAISGIALDTKGQPLPALRVHAFHEDSASSYEYSFENPRGEFTLPNLAPGSLRLSVAAGAERIASADLTLAPGQRVSGVRLAVQSLQELDAAESAALDRAN